MTTRRFITSAVLSATLLASQSTMLRAESSSESGLPACCCAYSMWTCTYNDGSYWTGCDPTFPSGQLWTLMAWGRCETWHAAP
jgi:hypothetical protein